MASVSTTPFADPLWLNRSFSPYYTDSHRRLQKEAREYVDTYISPFCEEWEKQGAVPQEVSSIQTPWDWTFSNVPLPSRFISDTQNLDTLLSAHSHSQPTI